MTKVDIKKEIRYLLYGIRLHKWRCNTDIDYLIIFCTDLFAKAYKAGKEAGKQERERRLGSGQKQDRKTNSKCLPRSLS